MFTPKPYPNQSQISDQSFKFWKECNITVKFRSLDSMFESIFIQLANEVELHSIWKMFSVKQ